MNDKTTTEEIASLKAEILALRETVENLVEKIGDESRVIRAKQFVAVQDGIVRVALGMIPGRDHFEGKSQKLARLALYDVCGIERLRAEVDEAGNSAISLRDEDGQAMVTLALKSDNSAAGLRINWNNGKPAASFIRLFGEGAVGSALVFCDAAGRDRAEIGVASDVGPLVSVINWTRHELDDGEIIYEPQTYVITPPEVSDPDDLDMQSGEEWKNA